MKDFIKRCLILSALIIITTFIVSNIIVGITPEIIFVYELVGVAVLICTAQEIIKKIEIKNYFLEIVMEYVTTVILVLGIGCEVGWFVKANWWMIFVYVTPIYIVEYELEVNLVNKNLQDINNALEKKRED